MLLIYVWEDLSFSFRFQYTQFTTVSRFAELPIIGYVGYKSLVCPFSK
jgi:hypothetical protein